MRFRHVEPTAADMAIYRDVVVPGMSPDDVHDAVEFAAMLGDGRLLAWFAVEEGEVVGWCALAPFHGGYAPLAWHLYGSWVRPDRRGRGVARLMWSHRLDAIPEGSTVTVSIQPGKEGSESLARSFGFARIGDAGPWVNYATTKGPGTTGVTA